MPGILANFVEAFQLNAWWRTLGPVHTAPTGTNNGTQLPATFLVPVEVDGGVYPQPASPGSVQHLDPDQAWSSGLVSTGLLGEPSNRDREPAHGPRGVPWARHVSDHQASLWSTGCTASQLPSLAGAHLHWIGFSQSNTAWRSLPRPVPARGASWDFARAPQVPQLRAFPRKIMPRAFRSGPGTPQSAWCLGYVPVPAADVGRDARPVRFPPPLQHDLAARRLASSSPTCMSVPRRSAGRTNSQAGQAHFRLCCPAGVPD